MLAGTGTGTVASAVAAAPASIAASAASTPSATAAVAAVLAAFPVVLAPIGRRRIGQIFVQRPRTRNRGAWCRGVGLLGVCATLRGEPHADQSRKEDDDAAEQ